MFRVKTIYLDAESASCDLKNITKIGPTVYRTLLQKGLAFARAPTVHDALEGKLPHRYTVVIFDCLTQSKGCHFMQSERKRAPIFT